MLLVTCPYCGPRPEVEFRYGGEAHIARPANASTFDDQAFAEYLFYRSSPRGPHAERWLHAFGCGRWFNAVRDTVSDAFITTYLMGQKRPDLAGEDI